MYHVHEAPVCVRNPFYLAGTPITQALAAVSAAEFSGSLDLTWTMTDLNLSPLFDVLFRELLEANNEIARDAFLVVAARLVLAGAKLHGFVK